MEAGEIYDFWDDEVEARKNFAIVKCKEYNEIDPLDNDARWKYLNEWLGAFGKSSWVASTFNCDYGKNIYMGGITITLALSARLNYYRINIQKLNGLNRTKISYNRPINIDKGLVMVGREKELNELEKLYDSGKAELVAIYGRRRIGKTFLVDEAFQDRIIFRHAGLSPLDEEPKGLLNAQLNHFYNSLKLYGVEEVECPKNWLDAFLMLEKYLQRVDDGSRQVIFLDELPWLDTPRSGFIRAFEGFWNTWGCHRKNLMVIICGSANSWMLNELINNHGGLYGRVTYEIKLAPFNLSECEEYYKSKGIPFSRYDIVQSYMIFGGIPFYMGYIDESLSLAQNVDKIFFSNNGELKLEYDRLFSSVFKRPEIIKTIVELLYTRNMGYTRKDIANRLKLSDGGHLTKDLNALIASDFVKKYVPFGLSSKEAYYKLVDPFCLFYLHFVKNTKTNNKRFWQQNTTQPEVVAWRGYAFENVCFNHIEQIKQALGISGVITLESAWTKKADDEDGLQIDLLILRKDNAINMCEIKFYSDDYVVSKEYYRTIQRRIESLLNKVSPKISVYSTLITTYGLKRNEYSGAFVKTVTFDDMFMPQKV